MPEYNSIKSAVQAGEPLFDVSAASSARNIGRWKLRRAIKAGQIPTYRIGTGTILLKLSDLDAAINASARVGGAQ